MNWKVFLTACISAVFISFPQNILGCGDTEDPYDYFTSFFSRDAGDVKGYQPFYYTALLTFYDDWLNDQPVNYENDKVIQEWKQYCKKPVSTNDAVDFIYTVKWQDINKLADNITKNKPIQLPDSILKNGMTKYFTAEKNTTALDYILFAKKASDFSTSADWQTPPERDSIQVNTYITQADNLYKKAGDEFLKSKYAFLRCKLAFYNNRLQDCIKWYDEYFTPGNKAAVNELALSYKAGSLFRLGKNKEAAYAFSKAFTLSDFSKRKNFLGFLWATEQCNPALEKEYVAMGKTNEEKANILGMFSLYGTSYDLNNLQQVYSLFPASSMLDILAIREINKLEEQYYTPVLAKEKGGKAFYTTWEDDKEKEIASGKQQLVGTIHFFEKLSNDNAITNRGLYFVGAAYLSFINKDYPKAKTLLAAAKNTRLSEKLNDQSQLITLLIAANEKPSLDAETEKTIFPAIEWLTKKAEKDPAFRIFFRNLFSQIIAQKYEQQGDDYRAALAYGVADGKFFAKKTGEDDYTYQSGNGLYFVRNHMNTDQVLKLYELVRKKPATPFEQYLVTHTSFANDDVVDVIGTSYLRDFNFEKAIEWLKKAGKPEALTASNYNYTTDKEITINVNSFHDYINDWQRYEKPVTKPYNKLTLATKLLDVQRSLDTAVSNDTKSKIYYQLASAFYNMSYYGNSWEAMAYDRSGVDWNNGNYKTKWEKEYYGVYKAREYYQKAFELSTSREFKAACFFLVAKCAQRQIPRPDYDYNNSAQYDKNMELFDKKFRNNALFATYVKDFGNTKFYKYSFDRCSYLRDFVNKK